MDSHQVQQARNQLAVGSNPDAGEMARNANMTIMKQLTAEELKKAKEDPDINKKLRVDRIRRLALYKPEQAYGHQDGLDDPTKEEWQKDQTLNEIKVLRKTLKQDLIQSKIS